MPLHDGDGVVRPLPYRLEADIGDLGCQRSGADDEHGSARRETFRKQPGGALRTGDDIVRVCGESHRTQVLGDLIRCAGRVVGHIQLARGDGRQRVYGTRRRLLAPKHSAVEIEK
jgi:hypothetical protein